MKTVFTLTFIFGLLFPSLAIADLQSECGQYFDEYSRVAGELKDVHQFQRESQAELNQFPPGKLTGKQLQEHQRLRQQGGALHQKERALQDRFRQAEGQVTRCVENYKRTHRQSGSTDAEVSNFERSMKEIQQGVLDSIR